MHRVGRGGQFLHGDDGEKGGVLECTRVLPKRGIWARADEILVTLGSQNALYLLASLLMARGVRVGVENPGFRDAASIFDIHGAKVHLQDVDDQGLVVDRRLDDCQYLYVTPGTRYPPAWR
ncbi:hypothetical protein [Ectopseudomonas oleovorans]|uniref:hypothetical protein n=1 Tax=Ectopseudomonas oleovorans TaxID=301 RepID=UPI00244A6A11|nr:hypothetical protein [Pseudomonas oleovorans]MDG9977922.1 hypothetical protein [Pseudomonas oleovorans]